jgi:hypothetical protein
MNRMTMLALAAVCLAGAAKADEAKRITFSKPAEKVEGCFTQAMRLPREVVERLPQRVEVLFVVAADGSVQNVKTDENANPVLATQIRGGLSRCAWAAGADEAGVPMAILVSMPVRFELSRYAKNTAIARVEEMRFEPVALASR